MPIDCAFSYCSGLTSVTIPDSVTSIGNFTFSSCRGLTSIAIGNRVTSLGEEAFCYCSGLTSITIPDSVISIGNYAFQGCTGLTSVTILDSVTGIGYRAFCNCGGLTSIVVKEGNSKYIAKDNCLIDKSTATLVLGCKTSVIPTDGSVTSIGDWAFNGCSGLTSVTIGNGVTSIGSYAFEVCSKLKRIDFNGTKAQWKAIEKGNNWGKIQVILLCIARMGHYPSRK